MSTRTFRITVRGVFDVLGADQRAELRVIVKTCGWERRRPSDSRRLRRRCCRTRW
ncbi:DUF6204 family protein [Streptomyces sp. NPDC002913]